MKQQQKEKKIARKWTVLCINQLKRNKERDQALETDLHTIFRMSILIIKMYFGQNIPVPCVTVLGQGHPPTSVATSALF